MKPLLGLRVVGIVMNLPGPLVLWRLAGFGAQVVKVEPPAGDPLGHFFPDLYKKLTAGQEVVRMDLKDAPKLHSLLKGTDLLVTAMRARTVEKLGLGWPNLQSHFSQMSHLSITGYAGADESWSGHDLTYQAAKGFVWPPHLPMNCWSDLIGAQEGVMQSLALIMGAKDGKSAKAEVSLAGVMDYAGIPIDYGMFGPDTPLTGALPQYQVYETLKGWVALAVLEPHFLQRFQSLTGVGELTTENLKNLFATKTADQWEVWAKEHDLPLAKVRERTPR